MKLVEIHGVRGYIDESGTAQLNLDDVSRGLGFIQNKNGASYVRWDRVNGYLTDLGFPQLVGKDFIPENVFYRLSMKGETESAIRFQSKVADEILPSIRKHGAYMTPDTIEKTLTSPDFIIQLATRLKEEQAEREREHQARIQAEAQIAADRHKVIFADCLQVSQDSILIGQLAKLLKQNGINIGQNRLFQVLREEGYLMSRGERYNMPTQRSMEMKLMEIKVGSRSSLTEGTKVTQTTKVTGKGVMYFINKFKAASEPA